MTETLPLYGLLMLVVLHYVKCQGLNLSPEKFSVEALTLIMTVLETGSLTKVKCDHTGEVLIQYYWSPSPEEKEMPRVGAHREKGHVRA